MTTLSELVLWYSELHKACFVTKEEDNSFGTKMLVSQLTPTVATVYRKLILILMIKTIKIPK